MTEEELAKFIKGPSEEERLLLRAKSYLRTLSEITEIVRSSLPSIQRTCRSLDIASMTMEQKRRLGNLLVKQCIEVFKDEKPIMQLTYIGMIHEFWNDLVRKAEVPMIEIGRKVTGSGPRGGERNPETIKKLQKRNIEIGKRYAHYIVTRANDPIGALARSYRRSRRQINRILKEQNKK